MQPFCTMFVYYNRHKQKLKMENVLNRPTTKEEIEKFIRLLIKTSENECKQIEEFAANLGQHANTDYKRKVYNQITEHYPETRIVRHCTIDLFHVEDTAKNIERALPRVKQDGLSQIYFHSIDVDKKKVTLSGWDSYHFHHFCDFFKIDIEVFKNSLVKEYKNGKRIYDLSDNPITFDKFREIVQFSTHQTEKMLNAITPEDKIKFLELSKSSYGNIYNVVHDIRKRVGVNPMEPYNVHTILEALTM